MAKVDTDVKINKCTKKSQRRPDIDVIRIVLTWAILLFHTALIYSPLAWYYVKIVPDHVPPWHLLGSWFTATMDVWQMPMFFFLSGISAYYGLNKRSEMEFRKERIHRLLIPGLVLSLTASFPISLNWFSKLSPNCESYFYGNEESNSKENKKVTWNYCAMVSRFTVNDTFPGHLRDMMITPVYLPSPHQGWFLFYLLVFSQVLARLLVAVHPKHQGFNFFGVFTLDNKTLLKAVKLLLGNPAKLFLVPGLLIGIVEVSLRWKFPTSFNLIFDICNDINFILVFLLGFGIAASDDHGMKEVVRKGRWYNLVIGVFFLICYPFFYENIMPYPVFHSETIAVRISARLAAGFGEWLFIIGVYGVTRELVTTPHPLVPVLSELLMPFYLTHQQILVSIASAASWIPYLRSFPVILTLSTAATLLVSWLITKSGSLRYLFGLPTKYNSLLPGSRLDGFGFLIVLIILYVTVIIFGNFVWSGKEFTLFSLG